MSLGTYAPDPTFTGWDANGDPLSSGKLYTYVAGTSTAASTFSEVTLTSANANPIILDSAGRATIFLTPGASYKFILKDSSDVTIWTRDNIAAIPTSSSNQDVTGVAGEALSAGQIAYLSDGSGSKAAGQWFKADNTNPYSSTLPEVGAVIAAIASGSSGTIRLGGQATGFSSLTVGTTYYVSAAGAVTSTVPANRRPIGVADTTSTIIIASNPPLAANPWTKIANTDTSTQNNWAPGMIGNTVIFWSGASDVTISGLTIGTIGQLVTLNNTGTKVAYLVHQSGSSSTGNKFRNIATSGNTPVAPGGSATFGYDGTDWRLMQHEQGAWITPGFSAGDFTANGSQTWTVASGDVTTMQYRLSGRTLHVNFRLVTTTVGGVANSQLLIGNGQWGGFTAAKSSVLATHSDDNAGGIVASIAQPAASGTTLPIYKSTAGAGNWAAATDTTSVFGCLTFEVT